MRRTDIVLRSFAAFSFSHLRPCEKLCGGAQWWCDWCHLPDCLARVSGCNLGLDSNCWGVPADHKGTGAIFDDYIFPIIAKYSQTYLATFMTCWKTSALILMQLLQLLKHDILEANVALKAWCFAIAKSSLSALAWKKRGGYGSLRLNKKLNCWYGWIG